MGLELLASHGANPNLNRFKRLRHTGNEELWELRTQARPAYRLLFAPTPAGYVVLHLVRKDEMARDPKQHITRALRALRDWNRS